MGTADVPPRRDRWLERVNADASAGMDEAKYDVSRRIGGGAAKQIPLLGEATAA